MKAAWLSHGYLGTAALVLAVLAVVCGHAEAGDARFAIIGEGTATDISPDGSVIVGSTKNTQETWRWTEESGQVLLGNEEENPSQGDPGTPDISGDGRTVSATLNHDGETGGHHGLWQEGSGWSPPLSSRRGVTWGMSDDARIHVGLIWNDSGSEVLAQAAAWDQAGELVLLGDSDRNSRANDTNQDGKVIVGWSEDPETGAWQPSAWTGDGTTILAATRAYCEATAVSPDGRIIVGQSYDEFLNQRGAALWLISDYGWVQETLGSLPVTIPGYGYATALDLSATGRVIVGLNRFDWDRTTGFVWTPNGGMQDIRDYLGGQGIVIPEDFTIDAVTAISDDGKVITGHGTSRGQWPYRTRSFMARVSGEGGNLAGEAPPGAPDMPPDPFGIDPWLQKWPRGRLVPE